MSNVAMLYHGNNEELHPTHRGFAESIGADILSIADVSPHSSKSFYQEMKSAYTIGEYDIVIAEGSRPLYTGLLHKLLYRSKLVYLCADHRLYQIWNNSVDADSTYGLFKSMFGQYGKPIIRVTSQRGIDGVIAVSEYVEGYLSKILQQNVPTQIAHPYIQQELYQRLGEVEPSVNNKVAVTVGRSARYKGVDLLVEAWPAVREQHPNAELHIVGSGHPESFEDTPGVVVRGFVDDLVQVYQNAGLYVQPARIDPFPVAVLEALRAGLPAVVTESTGSRSEVSKLREDLITSATPRSLSKKINQYFSFPQKEKEDLSAIARNRGAEFGPEQRKKLFRESFQELVAGFD